jgi:hypothetical protein
MELTKPPLADPITTIRQRQVDLALHRQKWIRRMNNSAKNLWS